MGWGVSASMCVGGAGESASVCVGWGGEECRCVGEMNAGLWVGWGGGVGGGPREGRSRERAAGGRPCSPATALGSLAKPEKKESKQPT